MPQPRRSSQSGIEVEGPKPWQEYAPDYYALFFSDPDGIRLEIVNHFERRKTLQARWHELEGFENALRLLAKKNGAGFCRDKLWSCRYPSGSVGAYFEC